MMKNKQLIITAACLVVFAAMSRLVSHPMNFTPITALILFSVFAFEGKWKIIVPFTAIVVSDALLHLNTGYGFHSGTWLVYSGYVCIALIGFGLLKKASLLNIILSSVAGSVAFFLLTNFAFFYPVATAANDFQGYSHNWSGIMASYVAGVPFFRNMLVGDVFYTSILFGAYFTVKHFVLKPAPIK